MKKLIFIAAFAACAFGMNAQLRVNSNGKVQIGNSSPVSLSPNPSIKVSASPSLGVQTDTISSLCIVSGPNNNGGGAYMTFGNGKNVGIGEYASITSPDTDILELFGSKGLQYTMGKKEVFYYAPITLSNTAQAAAVFVPAFTFNCDVKASSFLTTSDARMKKDISGIDGVGNMLENLEPISYRLAETPSAMEASLAEEEAADMTPVTLSDRVQYGFVAQEVQKIFPELVVEDADGYLSIDYLGFIPILVDAYKNLEAKVKEQDETIALLSNNNARKSPSTGIDGILADGKATLFQNKPNPFRESTSIECVVPQGSTEAFVCVYDLQGSQVKRFDITERGNCSVSVDGSSLKPGMYVYALIIDGAEIDSKKMILTD